MNESDYHQTNWEADLKHKHSPAGKREKKIKSIKMRGKKWYARKAVWAGLFFGLVVGFVIFQVSMKPARLVATPEPAPTGWLDTSAITPNAEIYITGGGSQ